ncbi:MAG: hypothetical protein ACI4QV_05130 [Acutalibacteraceae bacterium]
MIKGVNKRIIEIKDLDSKYFDSALLFVNPIHDGSDERKMEDEANKILSKYGDAMGGLCGVKKARSKLKIKKQYPLCFAAGTAVGCAVSFLITRFI